MKKHFLYLMMAGSVMIACNNPDTGEGKTGAHAGSTTEAAKEANDQSAVVDNETTEFLMKAAMGGMMEVQAGQLAQTNAASQQVKDFGNRMVTDHGQANQELMSLAQSKNVTLPTVLEGEHREHVTDLGKKSGKEFDKAYMDMMVKDHNKDVEMFENAANNSKDATVKAFAAKTLPILRQHLELAKSVHDQVRK